MKNKKGFTLIELLAVILLLSIIAAVAIPKTYRYVKDKEEGENTIIQDKFINAAKIYFAKEVGISNIDDDSSVTVATLLSKGLIDSAGECATDGKIEVDIDDNNFIKYSFLDMDCVADGSYDD